MLSLSLLPSICTLLERFTHKNYKCVIGGASIQPRVNYQYRSDHPFIFFASNKFSLRFKPSPSSSNSKVDSFHLLPCSSLFFCYQKLILLVFVFQSHYPEIVSCLIPSQDHLMVLSMCCPTQRSSTQAERWLCLPVHVLGCKI